MIRNASGVHCLIFLAMIGVEMMDILYSKWKYTFAIKSSRPRGIIISFTVVYRLSIDTVPCGDRLLIDIALQTVIQICIYAKD